MASRLPRLRRGPLAAVTAIAALLLVLPTTSSATAQSAPTTVSVPGPVTEAGQGDRDAYVPARTAPDAPPPPVASLTATYGAGFPVAAQTAVAGALNAWGALITSSQPISISFLWENVGGLGRADANFHTGFANQPIANTFYPRALAEALSGQNLGGAEPDITIRITPRNDWYYGTDGNTPAAQFDLMTIVMHEVLHGLGMLTSMTVSGGQGSWGLGTGIPLIYDRFLEDNSGQALVSYTNGSAALATALQSGQVRFDSPRTNRNVLSHRVRIHSPNPFTGSSIQHFDESYYPTSSANSMATPTFFASEAVHYPGPLPLCMLEALGWTTTVDCTPPGITSVTGFTWFSDGSTSGSGPSGSQVRAFASSTVTGRTYKLVSGLDGGIDWPCMWETVAINPNNRVPSSSGVIGQTNGTINRTAGRYDICFREETGANTVIITAPLPYRVT